MFHRFLVFFKASRKFAFGVSDITLVTIFAWDRVDGATSLIFRYWVFRLKDLSVRARKNLNSTLRPMPSWVAGIHHEDHIIGSNVAFLLNLFVSSVQCRQVFLHQSLPTLGFEILCKPSSISGVEREVINDPGCKLSAHLAVKEVVGVKTCSSLHRAECLLFSEHLLAVHEIS